MLGLVPSIPGGGGGGSGVDQVARDAASAAQTDATAALTGNAHDAIAREAAAAHPRYRRRYLGSERLMTSGIWSKATALALPILTGYSESEIEADIVAVGGGAGGHVGVGTSPASGGNPGTIESVTKRLEDVALSVEYIIGDGGIGGATVEDYGSIGSPGGNTIFGDYVTALGGLCIIHPSDVGWMMSSIIRCTKILGSGDHSTALYVYTSDFDVSAGDSRVGPGAGGAFFTGWPSFRGGNSNNSIPEHSIRGPDGVEGTTVHGINASSAFQYGTGGAGQTGDAPAGNGGNPGGGGGAATYINPTGGIAGDGGRGEVRMHYYVWEAV